jgi:hypothetical protein
MIRQTLILVALFTVLCGEVLAADRMNLSATAVQGNRELPKSLYIVPWKSTRLAALTDAGQGLFRQSTWQRLDRAVFQRQLLYYEKLYGSAGYE